MSIAISRVWCHGFVSWGIFIVAFSVNPYCFNTFSTVLVLVALGCQQDPLQAPNVELRKASINCGAIVEATSNKGVH